MRDGGPAQNVSHFLGLAALAPRRDLPVCFPPVVLSHVRRVRASAMVTLGGRLSLVPQHRLVFLTWLKLRLLPWALLGSEGRAVMNNLCQAEEVLEYFKPWNLDDESRQFLAYHSRRYSLLLRKVNAVAARVQSAGRPGPLRILDIGPGFQTELLRQVFATSVINSLGFRDTRFQPRLQDRHFEFDLNDAQFADKWPVFEAHDVIVMAEVIEHLYTAPTLVLRCVASWLKSDGWLIVQTPNACSLHKRLRLLVGRNPYEPIRVTRNNPGHFHEYTRGELISMGGEAGLVPADVISTNYFDNGSLSHKLYNAVSRFLPGSLRQGITITFHKQTST